MDCGSNVSGSNCGQLGPNLPMPIPKFEHEVVVTLDIAAPGSILIVSRLIVLEIKMEKTMIMHPLGVLLPQILITILILM